MFAVTITITKGKVYGNLGGMWRWEAGSGWWVGNLGAGGEVGNMWMGIVM